MIYNTNSAEAKHKCGKSLNTLDLLNFSVYFKRLQ